MDASSSRTRPASAGDRAAYRTLLRCHGATVPIEDLAGLWGLTRAGALSTLSRLVAHGLATTERDAAHAVAPAPLVEQWSAEQDALLSAAREQLAAVRALLPAVSEPSARDRARDRASSGFETVRVAEVAPVLRRLCEEHEGDLWWLRPDQWRQPDRAATDDWVEPLLRQGRTLRAIYPARILEEGHAALVRRVWLGEQARVIAELPGRLLVVGDSVAIIPRSFDLSDGLALVVEQPALVTSLRLLAESLWERALVVPGLERGTETGHAGSRRLLLDQLARGVKDEQIARALGQSVRTVRRRVASLLEELDTTSRFQAGVEAVRRGWL